MQDWKQKLDKTRRGDHAVLYYEDEPFLHRAVGRYLGAGLSSGERTILISKPGNIKPIAFQIEEFTERPVAEWIAETMLLVLDAESVLDTSTVDGYPDWKFFSREIRPLVEDTSRTMAVRAYCEMVDLLWQRGAKDAALRLEDYWNRLIDELEFSLLCAYKLNPLEPEVYDENFVGVCQCHSSILPPADAERFHRHVDERLGKVLGSSLFSMVTSMAARDDRRETVPNAHKYLLWLARNMPATAKRVLSQGAAQKPPGSLVTE